MNPSIQPTQQFLTTFNQSFRDRVHQLVQLGYQKARSKINSQTEETHITTHISEAIDDILQDPNSSWDYFDIDEDSLVRKNNTYGKSKPRIDIVIKFCAGSPRPKYLFEAKRLRTPSYPASVYTGKKGLQCFTEGLYGSEYPETAMLGYVQSHSIAYWKLKVTRQIDKEATLLELKSTQYDYLDPNAFPLEWISQHTRTKVGRPVTIYHILLDCI